MDSSEVKQYIFGSQYQNQIRAIHHRSWEKNQENDAKNFI